MTVLRLNILGLAAALARSACSRARSVATQAGGVHATSPKMVLRKSFTEASGVAVGQPDDIRCCRNGVLPSAMPLAFPVSFLQVRPNPKPERPGAAADEERQHAQAAHVLKQPEETGDVEIDARMPPHAREQYSQKRGQDREKDRDGAPHLRRRHWGRSGQFLSGRAGSGWSGPRRSGRISA